jgi:hypothetical protein
MNAAAQAHRPARLRAEDEAAALEDLHRMGCTDGLPVVIPTPARVERMVLALGDDADLSLGAMGPNLGACTVEKLATAAVMAGCLPDYAPVVRAAALAILDPVFDLTEVQSTTHSIAPLFIVNGPARELCGPIASGTGALGPGHRANASIGRALRLAMINIGGGRPGISDMALLGHPGKFSFCMAEAEEASPFPPLHTTRGFEAEQSVVTVIGTESPHSVVIENFGDPTSGERLLRSLASTLARIGNNNSLMGASTGSTGQVAVVLNPEHADTLHRQGYTRESVAAGIVEHAIVSRAQLRNAMGPAHRIEPGSEFPCFQSPDDLLIVVAGGGGMYSAVLPSWGGGPHANRAVSKEIVLDAACDVPNARREAAKV